MNKENSVLSYTMGWISMIFGSLTLNDFAVILGMFATILGLVITWRYKHLEYKLKKKQLERSDDAQKYKK